MSLSHKKKQNKKHCLIRPLRKGCDLQTQKCTSIQTSYQLNASNPTRSFSSYRQLREMTRLKPLKHAFELLHFTVHLFHFQLLFESYCCWQIFYQKHHSDETCSCGCHTKITLGKDRLRFHDNPLQNTAMAFYSLSIVSI